MESIGHCFQIMANSLVANKLLVVILHYKLGHIKLYKPNTILMQKAYRYKQHTRRQYDYRNKYKYISVHMGILLVGSNMPGEKYCTNFTFS